MRALGRAEQLLVVAVVQRMHHTLLATHRLRLPQLRLERHDRSRISVLAVAERLALHERKRIAVSTLIDELEVHVRSHAATGAAELGERLTLIDAFTRAYEDALIVSVQ